MTKQERTEKLLAYFKGIPDEFSALKGVLLVDAVDRDLKPIGGNFDRIKIAERMEEINRGG